MGKGKGLAGHINEPILAATGICKNYGAREALRGVDLRVRTGEKVGILGPSGSGKSTLLRCLNLLVEPTAGRLQYRDSVIGEWEQGRRSVVARGELARYRARVAMVFQHFELFSHLTVLGNITLGPRKSLGVPKEQAETKAHALLKRMGLDGYAEAYPHTLSGGQQQRVAIARALAMEPDLILFDEPTSALDPELVGEVLDVMADLAQDGMTMVIVTHELGFVRDIADRIIVMQDGLILEEGAPSAIFNEASEPRTREFIGSLAHRRSIDREATG